MLKYPMGFAEAITRYADFSGRSSRDSYWRFALTVAGALFFLSVLTDDGGNTTWTVLAWAWLAVWVIPLLSFSLRRLRDTGLSTWWALPLLGGPFALGAALWPLGNRVFETSTGTGGLVASTLLFTMPFYAALLIPLALARRSSVGPNRGGHEPLTSGRSPRLLETPSGTVIVARRLEDSRYETLRVSEFGDLVSDGLLLTALAGDLTGFRELQQDEVAARVAATPDPPTSATTYFSLPFSLEQTTTGLRTIPAYTGFYRLNGLSSGAFLDEKGDWMPEATVVRLWASEGMVATTRCKSEVSMQAQLRCNEIPFVERILPPYYYRSDAGVILRRGSFLRVHRLDGAGRWVRDQTAFLSLSDDGDSYRLLARAQVTSEIRRRRMPGAEAAAQEAE